MGATNQKVFCLTHAKCTTQSCMQVALKTHKKRDGFLAKLCGSKFICSGANYVEQSGASYYISLLQVIFFTCTMLRVNAGRIKKSS